MKMIVEGSFLELEGRAEEDGIERRVYLVVGLGFGIRRSKYGLGV